MATAKKAKPTQKRAPKAAEKTIWVMRDRDAGYREDVAVYDYRDDLLVDLEGNVETYGDTRLKELEVLECKVIKAWTPSLERNILLK